MATFEYDAEHLAKLTRTQLETLRLIARYRQMHRCGPTMRDITDSVPGINSTSVANYTMSKLRRMGLVRWARDARGKMLARSMYLTPDGERVLDELRRVRA